MEINASAPHKNLHTTPPAPTAFAHPASKNSNTQPTNDAVAFVQDESSAVASDAKSDDNKVRGVMRLLQDGHFRGVADVRLRINFNDEISALQSEATGAVIEKGVEDIVGALQSELTASLEANPLDENLAASIDESSTLMFAEFMSIQQSNTGESSPQTSVIISEIQTAFDTFITSITTSQEPSDIAPDAESSGLKAETLTLIESGDDEGQELTTQNAFDQLVANLTETFSAKLSSFENALNEASVLPDLSEPTGNGKAYNKFLAIYNNMNGPAEDSPTSELVDAIV